MYSPSCGVKTVPAARDRTMSRAPSPPQATANSPSPSMTIGICAPAMMRRASLTVPSSRPSPGPTTIALKRDRSSSTSCDQPSAGNARRTISVGVLRSLTMPGEATCTIPAPDRIAAALHKLAAPIIPELPATAYNAAFHLCESNGRCGTHCETSLRSTSLISTLPIPRLIPISTSSTSPHKARPAPNSNPGFKATNVTVRVACQVSGAARPVSPSIPLGISTAKTGTPWVDGGLQSSRKPVPKAASMMRSLTGKRNGMFSALMTCTRTP